jgi:hypothetical protein
MGEGWAVASKEWEVGKNFQLWMRNWIELALSVQLSRIHPHLSVLVESFELWS